MAKGASETTRLLCANAFTGGASFRATILKYLREKHQALAPEMGIDVPQLAAVCRAADRREIVYAVVFVAVGFVSLLVLAGTEASNYVPVLILLGLVFGGMYFFKVLRERCFLIRPFLRRNFDPERIAQMYPVSPAEIETMDGAANQNLIVYKGFVPFVGAGQDFGGWSFAVSTIRGCEEGEGAAEPIPFRTSELYTDIEAGLSALSVDGMNVNDFFFVSGADIRNDRAVLPNEYGRPLRTLPRATAALYKDRCDPRIRHYRWIRIEDWGGEIEMSMFLRCAMRGSSLFVEMKRFLLTPLAQTYKKIDKIAAPSVGRVMLWMLESLVMGPLYLVFAALFLVGRLIEGITHALGLEDRKVQGAIREDPLFNYGAEATLRTMFSSGQYHHYFQKLDTDFYSKVLEQEILDSVVRFLEAHNIDTSEIKESKRTIMNNGIIVHGGDVKAESLAVGEGAKAVKKTRSARLRPKGAEA